MQQAGLCFRTMPPITPSPCADWCLFLDVDGTLIDFTDTPSATRSDAELNSLLQKLNESLGGSVALVSGRSIRTIDALFAPLKMPVAGLHGLERRGASGEIHGGELGDAALDRTRAKLRAFIAEHPGTVLEDKELTLAVHYRGAPRLEQRLRMVLHDVATDLGDEFHVQEGNLVMEIKPRRFTKATAIDAFMGESPFRGRIPVFVGDDITDEVGFRVVEERGGISVAVGDRVQAQWHLPDPAAVRAWLWNVAALGRPAA